MKNLSLIMLIFLIAFSSCKKVITPARPGNWDDYRKGYALIYKKNDSAFYYFNRATANTKDSLQVAMSYNSMAAIQSDAGDYFGAQESLSMSLRFLNESDPKNRSTLTSDYNELGMSGFNLKNYVDAIIYYNHALPFCDDSKLKAVILNNKATALQKMKHYDQAIQIYSLVLHDARTHDVEYARTLSNLVRTKWLKDQHFNAAGSMLDALQIRKNANDLWGANASYIHLSDYYAVTNPDSAIYYAQKEYAVARKLRSPDDRLEALGRLIRLGSEADAKTYFAAYTSLNDSLQTIRNAAKNQYALIRYNAEKNKADNLRLQKDNTEKKYELIRKNILLGGIIVLIVAGIALAYVWYNRKKEVMALEANQKVRESQLKTSKKVHDVVANGLYRMMAEIQNEPDVNKEYLLDKVEYMYEKSRDISYEEPLVSNVNFSERISIMLTSFGTAQSKVAIVGNSNALWEALASNIQYEVEQVLQELMVNMNKHSKASHVMVRFYESDGHMQIDYEDDGIGFPGEFHYKNGLTSTVNRIKGINGSITFETSLRKGAKIHIHFPLS